MSRTVALRSARAPRPPCTGLLAPVARGCASHVAVVGDGSTILAIHRVYGADARAAFGHGEETAIHAGEQLGQPQPLLRHSAPPTVDRIDIGHTIARTIRSAVALGRLVLARETRGESRRTRRGRGTRELHQLRVPPLS